jgi:hypothetical protein
MAIPKSKIRNDTLWLEIGHQAFKLEVPWCPQDEIDEGWTRENAISWYKQQLDTALSSIYEVEWEKELGW